MLTSGPSFGAEKLAGRLGSRIGWFTFVALTTWLTAATSDRALGQRTKQ